MHVLIFPVGSQGDVRPLLQIGEALRDRGHEVTVFVNERFEPMARAANLAVRTLGSREEYAAVLENPDLWHPRRGPRLLHDWVFGPDLKRSHDAVVEVASRPDTIVVGGTFAVGAGLAAEKRNLPLARVHGQPSVFFGPHDPPTLPSGTKIGGPLWLRRAMVGLLDATVLRHALGRSLNQARRELDLRPWTRNFMGSYVSADLNLCLFPQWFAPRTPDWPDNARSVGFVIPSETGQTPDGLSAFLDAGPPPLVFTPGPAGYQHSDRFFGPAAEACAHLGARGVFVTRGCAWEGDRSMDIFVCEYAPFADLFPQAAMVIHHGGIGTVAQALRAGVPQVITPFGFDQPDNAWRLRSLKVGELVAPQGFTGQRLAAMIQALSERPGVETVCEGFRERMEEEGEGSLVESCHLLEALPPRLAQPVLPS